MPPHWRISARRSARHGFSVIGGAVDELEDEVAIAVSGAHHDHHHTAVPYFAAGTIAGPEAPR